jgi:hypothetical protein
MKRKIKNYFLNGMDEDFIRGLVGEYYLWL